MKEAIFGDTFFQQCSELEKQNSELRFSNRILDLQLSTLKKKNEDVCGKRQIFNVQLQTEFAKLIVEQENVLRRLRRVYELVKEM